MSAGLGFSVEALLPRARGGGALRMGLARLEEHEWRDKAGDLAPRRAAFDAHPESMALLPEALPPGAELAAMLGVAGGLEAAARAGWEDLCLLTRKAGEDIYRLAGAAVAFPTDWHPAAKLGLPLAALHAPIHGYAQQLASGVDRFMASLKPGAIYGRCNWFIAPTPALRWIAYAPPQHAFAHVTKGNAGETLFVRCERQALRKLPQTGAVVFSIGIYIAPLGALPPAQAQWLADALASIPHEEAARRGAPCYSAAMQGYCEKLQAPSPLENMQ